MKTKIKRIQFITFVFFQHEFKLHLHSKHFLTLKTLGIIPARFASSLFPGKPLVDILGKSMLQRVYEQCLKAKCLDDVIIATDDIQIFNHIHDFGGKVMMTSSHHINGTSRCNEVLIKLNTHNNNDYQYIINIQGDEPFIHPEQINELIAVLKSNEVDVATQVKKETNLALLSNSNCVKAILDEQFYVSDFCRYVPKNEPKVDYFYKHIGIYGFKTEVLNQLLDLEPTKNELERQLEQMRWLDNHFKIKAGITAFESISIDTPNDVEKAILHYNQLT